MVYNVIILFIVRSLWVKLSNRPRFTIKYLLESVFLSIIVYTLKLFIIEI